METNRIPNPKDSVQFAAGPPTQLRLGLWSLSSSGLRSAYGVATGSIRCGPADVNYPIGTIV